MWTETELMDRLAIVRDSCRDGINGLNGGLDGDGDGWEPDVEGFEAMIEGLDEIIVEITQRRIEIVDLLKKLIDRANNAVGWDSSIWNDVVKLRDRYSPSAVAGYGWTAKDAATAEYGGWMIGVAPEGNREIQRVATDDGSHEFMHDSAAKELVWRLSAKADGLHRRAIHSIIMHPRSA